MKRREILAGLGVGTLAGFGLIGRKTQAADILSADIVSDWKYTKIDPKKAADLAYELANAACMYATFRALLTTVADALQPTNPSAASMIMSFPFHMMGYGHGGIGAIGSTCGTFNGGSAVIGLFVKDADKRDEIIQELCLYYEGTPLPKYKPKNDQFPSMPAVVPESVLCHISSGRWRAIADVKISSAKRTDRCCRLAADITAKTAELLNRYHENQACTFAALAQPTATCVDCHGKQGPEADSIGKMTCATCHQEDESHTKKYLGMKK